ncbi:DNA-3-methyladenine glycosylase I [Enterococcus cecorum]|uniref:DNA-3-methyladenine glycosylase I n=1 Tax=Enterococcus cecorum TaxID=44008 RepID=UPI0006430848|nr:DNA-3-methyladenine glycosylase I [Enterococcus cecorum]KLO72652.1 3-methyladenine DNA glycosylase [Enterococcus cecorum]MDZ5501861.1 DNA-3-methyladenine glycosylase I [Enterococcus cecorum]MDZ5508537.1 DNA-3-methyladenine glycosylase I [Enterococcus cecorum]MDZ5555711.1 DNA-3-methyladenine glycosylase I [Enterococcus cecorum]MDZ5557562.1 DNA-3-methyladenine glycosylase I [Enterococcus cecorum]
MEKCSWALQSPQMQDYHDKRWGRACHDERLLFEYLVLEMMQAGLSWAIVLKKQAGFRRAFDDFDVQKIATYNEEKIAALCQNPAIIRNRMKIQAVISNAQAFLALQATFGSFDAYIWSFTDYQVIHHQWHNEAEIPSQDALSQKISKDLKKRGFRFVGPTIIYSYLQAIGVINDHLLSCPCYDEILAASQVK